MYDLSRNRLDISAWREACSTFNLLLLLGAFDECRTDIPSTYTHTSSPKASPVSYERFAQHHAPLLFILTGTPNAIYHLILAWVSTLNKTLYPHPSQVSDILGYQLRYLLTETPSALQLIGMAALLGASSQSSKRNTGSDKKQIFDHKLHLRILNRWTASLHSSVLFSGSWQIGRERTFAVLEHWKLICSL